MEIVYIYIYIYMVRDWMNWHSCYLGRVSGGCVPAHGLIEGSVLVRQDMEGRDSSLGNGRQGMGRSAGQASWEIPV